MSKKYKILFLALATVVVVGYIVLDVFIKSIENNDYQEDVRGATESFIEDLYKKGSKEIYNTYFSSDIKNEYSLSEWKYVHNNILELHYIEMAELIDERIGYSKVLIGDEKDHYVSKPQLILEPDKEDSVESVVNWIEEDGELKVYYIELPIQLSPEFKFTTFGVQ
ncbi:hypothetical protein E3U55_10060 [Filobacillus milosensis]|uniref:Uncharacterized protein n=1 Tax=Filobacillus milosensis TaxID=94137 RepID=A0A4Y8IMN3_9BACI|nr:hypothetical protein [Filobacillus milosensis]TFB19500.1 hypothetical protein E3U55_10060 [Filobacillus milosensis]